MELTCIHLVIIFLLEVFHYSRGQYGTSCNSTFYCEEVLENSICKNRRCQCKPDHFLGQELNKTLCVVCPALGEHCGNVQCCRHSSYLVCSEGFCRCRNSYDGIYCWNANSAETVQFESIAQMVLGLALVFTIAVLGSLVWRLCSRQDTTQCSQVGDQLNRDTSFASLNSIQQLVLIRLQDRPPPYNPNYQPTSKNYPEPIGINNQAIPVPLEAPPPYTTTVSCQIPAAAACGRDNPAFCAEELQQRPQLQQSIAQASSDSSVNGSNPVSTNSTDKRTSNQSHSPEYSECKPSSENNINDRRRNLSTLLDKNKYNN